MSKKIWKDHLLSSGVPLEYSVIRIFEKLGIRDPGEYRYERKTEDGLQQTEHRGFVGTCLPSP